MQGSPLFSFCPAPRVSSLTCIVNSLDFRGAHDLGYFGAFGESYCTVTGRYATAGSALTATWNEQRPRIRWQESCLEYWCQNVPGVKKCSRCNYRCNSACMWHTAFSAKRQKLGVKDLEKDAGALWGYHIGAVRL